MTATKALVVRLTAKDDTADEVAQFLTGAPEILPADLLAAK